MLIRALFSLIDIFGDTMGDIVDHINPRNILKTQKVHSLTLLLTEYRDHNIGTHHFTMIGGINLKHSALQYTLKAVCGLCLLL